MLCAGVSPPPGHDWPIDGTSLAPMLRAQGRLARPSRAALGWVTGHYSSQAMTGLPVSSCDSGACPLTRYDHGRITRSIRPPVEQMAWLDNHLKLYANRTIANLTHPEDPNGNRTAHPYSCEPPTAICPR